MTELLEFDLHIFDLDATLINTRQTYYSAQEAAVRQVFPELTGKSLLSGMRDLRWLCRIFGSGNTEAYFSAFIASQPDLQDAGEDSIVLLTAAYQNAFLANLKPLAGAKTYLRSISISNKKLALVSNGNKNSQLQKLHSTDLDVFFPEPVCFISEAYLPAQKKPSPHMVNLACDFAGIVSELSVFYGNSIEDILSGNLAGVTTVLIGENPGDTDNMPEIARPDFYLKSWID
ncbi:MAG: HAD hydrolase-like protein [SAR324 cluster bacterium]|nr:HAD hydrolase-like protein [SAR324 cluster bacterium]